MRVLRLLLPALLCVLVLAACSPPRQPIAGLTVLDGEPAIVFAACDLSFATVGIYRHDPSASPGSSPSSWDLYGDPAEQVVEFKLWEPPAGWRVSRSGLTELEAGETYSVGGLSRWHAIPVDFTVDDLDRLDAGHVLAGRLGKEPAVVSRAEFEKTAGKACRKK